MPVCLALPGSWPCSTLGETQLLAERAQGQGSSGDCAAVRGLREPASGCTAQLRQHAEAVLTTRGYGQGLLPAGCRSRRKRRRSCAVRSINGWGPPGGSDGGSLWEGEEGKKRMRDIEEMRELMRARNEIEADIMRGQGEAQAAGVGDGKSEEELAQERAEKLQEELARRAMEQAERRKQAETMYELGQRAYGKGMYNKSVEMFEAALTNVERRSNLGGEIQIWLALAYDANNRRGDCIATYKWLEARHPSTALQRQAKNLRYIAEAPKLKLSEEETLTIPLLNRDMESNQRTWSQMVKERRAAQKKATQATQGTQRKSYFEDWTLGEHHRPRWERSPYFWVALSVWLTAVGVSLVF